MDEKAPFISASEREATDLESADSQTTQNQQPTRLRLLRLFIIASITSLVFLKSAIFGGHALRCRSHSHSQPHFHSQSHSQSRPLPTVRPSSMSMCDYYALRNYDHNTLESQKLLIQSIVDKAFVGARNPDVYFLRRFGAKSGMYNGILRSGDMWETPVDLTKYFDGSLNSTNVDGKATEVNFFSGEKFTQYEREYPAGNELYSHMVEGMYKYVAPMLGCSIYGNTMERYAGTRSMKEIHKYMDLGKNFEWAYFTHQFQLGALAAGRFSEYDSNLFEVYLIDKFGPKIIDRAEKKFSAPFENPELDGSIMPPKFDEMEIMARVEDAAYAFVGRNRFENQKRSEEPESHINDNKKRVQNPPSRVKRQNFDSTPPPLTTPVLAPSQTGIVAPTVTQDKAESVPSNILPIALGAGIGAGLGVIIIGFVIAYLVIRKKRIQKRKSMPQLSLKPGIEMQKKDSVSRRVDRSEHGNVVGKPKDYDQHHLKEQELEPPKMGHKKSESVGVRSVRFSQHDG